MKRWKRQAGIRFCLEAQRSFIFFQKLKELIEVFQTIMACMHLYYKIPIFGSIKINYSKETAKEKKLLRVFQ